MHRDGARTKSVKSRTFRDVTDRRSTIRDRYSVVKTLIQSDDDASSEHPLYAKPKRKSKQKRSSRKQSLNTQIGQLTTENNELRAENNEYKKLIGLKEADIAKNIKKYCTKMIVTKGTAAQEENAKNIAKVKRLSSTLKRVSANESKLKRRQSKKADAHEKEIYDLRQELKTMCKAFDALQKRHMKAMKNKNEEMSDLQIAQKENQRILQKMKKQETKMAAIEDIIKRLQAQIIERNVYLEKVESKTDELMRAIQKQNEEMRIDSEKMERNQSTKADAHQKKIHGLKHGLKSKDQAFKTKKASKRNRKMHDKDEKLEQMQRKRPKRDKNGELEAIRITLDEMLAERDDLISEINEIRKRVSENRGVRGSV